MKPYILFCCFYVYLSSHYVIKTDAERLKKKIYINIEHTNACFKKLNATGQFGCSSHMSGNIGVVFVLKTDADMQWLLRNASHQPYVVMMDALWFNRDNLDILKNSGKVNGVMLSYLEINSPGTAFPENGFSLDSACPLDDYGLYRNDPTYSHCKRNVWNPTGNDLLHEDLGMPIFLVANETDVEAIVDKCYRRFNERSGDDEDRAYPLCAAELKSGMYAVRDTVSCMRRSNHITNLEPTTYCQELRDHNVFGLVQSINNSETRPVDSVTVLGTRIDTTSLFDRVTPGADTSVTGIVTVLAIAEALKSAGVFQDIRATTKDLLFAFFHGETYDYIGSSRMVWDMQRGAFPYIINIDEHETGLSGISLEHLDVFMELSQLGHYEQGLHAFCVNWNSTDFMDFSNKMTSASEEPQPSLIVHHNQPLPPASVQRFLLKRRLPAVVYTDHGESFSNKFYNSRLDVALHINASYPENMNSSERYDHVTPQAENLEKIATHLARVLARHVANLTDTSHIQANVTEISHLLYCFLFSANCSLFRSVTHPEHGIHLPNTTLPLYISINDNSTIFASTIISSLLAYYTGDVEDIVTKDDCNKKRPDKTFKYFWMRGTNESADGVCIKSAVGISLAISPAFAIDDYDMMSGEYSTWTESTWDSLELRLFLIPSYGFQVMTLMVGIAILLVSHVVVFFINRKILIILGSDSRELAGETNSATNT